MTGALSGRGVLLWVVGFFGVIIAMNAWFVTASIRTFSGEDEQKPYLQGVEYNQTLSRRAAQQMLGWRATIASARQDLHTVRVTVILDHKDGSPVTGLLLKGELRHPSDEGRDRPAKFREVSAGRYDAEIRGIAPGAWDLMAQTGASQPPFETVRRLWLP